MPRGLRRAGPAVLAWVLGAVPVTGQARPAPDREDRSAESYRALVDSYRAGDRDAAVEALSQWSRAEVQRLAPRSLGGGVPVRAAAIALHTDVAFSHVSGGSTEEFDLHISRAESLDHPSLGGSFRALWRLAAGLMSFRPVGPGPAQRHFEHGLTLSEGEPNLLVALGATFEHQATQPMRFPDLQERQLAWRERQVLRRSRLSKAVSLYEQALGRDPGHAEARLRLARVQLRSGRVDEGLGHVDRVLGSSREPDLLYVAHLLAGRDRESRGDLEGAAAHYRKAKAADASGRVARIALSHALVALGKRDAAHAALLEALAPDESGVDPWRGLDQGRETLLRRVLAVLVQAARE